MRIRSGYATPALQDQRQKARWEIIQKVNQFKMRDRMPMYTRVQVPATDARRSVIVVNYREPTLFGIRHIQQAVKIARHHSLVDSKTLRKAGFNA